MNLLDRVLLRAPLKQAIFGLSKAVTCYDEKSPDSEFARDVASQMSQVSIQLDKFTRSTGLKKDQSTEACCGHSSLN